MDKKLQIKLVELLYNQVWLEKDYSKKETVEVTENEYILFSTETESKANPIKSN